MQLIHSIGRFVCESPKHVEVAYDLPYEQALGYIHIQGSHVHDMRDLYVEERVARGRTMGGVLPVWQFKSWKGASRGEVIGLLDRIDQRPLTFIELLAFANEHTLIEKGGIANQATAIALASAFRTEYGVASAVVVEFRFRQTRQKLNRKETGLASPDGKFGRGMIFLSTVKSL